MDHDRLRRVRELFDSALELEGEERAALLEKGCGDDAKLRREVESLLRHEEGTGDPLEAVVERAARELRGLEVERSTAAPSTLSWLAPEHLRDVRLWWVYLLIVALALYALAGSVYWTLTAGDTVSAGFSYLPRLLVRTTLDEAAREAGLRARDRVVAIDGVPVFDGRELNRRLAAVGPDAEVEIELERPGRGRFGATLATRRGGPTLFSSLGQLRGLVWVATGLLLFWFHPGRRESWAFLISTVAVGLPALLPLPDYFGGNYLPWLPHPLGRGWSVAVEGFIGPSCVAFFLLFPYPPSFLARRLWIVPLLFAPAAAWAVLFLPTYPWYPEYPRWERLADASYSALVTLTPLAVLVALAILIWRHRQPHPAKYAAQLRALVVASLLSFPLPAVAYAVGNISPQWVSDTWQLHALALNLPLLIFPPMVAYAIARHDMFEIDRLVARTAAYSVAVLVAGLAYAGAVVALPSVLAPRALAERPAVMALMILVAIAALRPVRDRVIGRIERGFRRHEPDPESKVRGLREALRALGSGASSQVLSQIERLIESSFGLDRVRFLVPGSGGWRTAVAGDSGSGVAPIGRDPEQLGVEQILPMRVGGEVVGGLGIGSPVSGGRLGSSDERALEAVALEAGRALRRSDPGQRIGEYRIVRLLASGGMGSVYLAVREGVAGFAKQVALKELLPEKAADVDMVRRFLAEARIAAQLDHPNIVQTYDLGETAQGYFIAMEYVPGIDAGHLLRDLERRGARLPLPVALHVASSVCLALDFAHHAKGEDGEPLGLVHRDVSPQNVLLSESGEVKLVDFGVAQLTYGDPRAGALVGKVAYMAPEQLRREPTDHRVDLFAAGVLLYELSTGSHPFRKASHRATWDAILRGTFLGPEALRPGLPSQLAKIVGRALRPEPGGRYRSGAEMAEALEAVTSPELKTKRQLGSIVRRLGEAAREDRLESGTTLALPDRDARPRTPGPSGG